MSDETIAIECLKELVPALSKAVTDVEKRLIKFHNELCDLKLRDYVPVSVFVIAASCHALEGYKKEGGFDDEDWTKFCKAAQDLVSRLGDAGEKRDDEESN